jgi:hypothetical protein
MQTDYEIGWTAGFPYLFVLSRIVIEIQVWIFTHPGYYNSRTSRFVPNKIGGKQKITANSVALCPRSLALRSQMGDVTEGLYRFTSSVPRQVYTLT